MIGTLLGAKLFSFLVIRVKLCVAAVAAIKLSIVDIGAIRRKPQRNCPMVPYFVALS